MQVNSKGAGALVQAMNKSTIKGTLQKTPQRVVVAETHHLALSQNETLQGIAPAPNNAPSDNVNEAKTMRKSKRLEPCGRCNVMTAVRVALPCGRLVNLCIPCASTFARFLSKRIREMARESKSREKAARKSAHPVHAEDNGTKCGKDPGLREIGHRSSSPLKVANDQLHERSLDQHSAARVLGRSGNSRTADSAREVLSPTLRARKASPQRRVSDPDVSRDRAARNRMNHCDMQLPGGHASPMVIADPFTPLPLNRDALSDSNVWLSASAGGVKQMAATQNHVRDADLLPLSLTNSRGRTQSERTSKPADLVQGGHWVSSIHQAVKAQRFEAQRAAATATGTTNFAAGKPTKAVAAGSEATVFGAEGDREPERDRLVFPHGRTVSQTIQSDKITSYLPVLKGACSESPERPIAGRAGSEMLPARTPPANLGLGVHPHAKESAVRRERVALGRGSPFNSPLASLDKFDYGMSPNATGSTREIRRKIVEEFRQGHSGKVSRPQHTARAGKSNGSSIPLKFALNTQERS